MNPIKFLKSKIDAFNHIHIWQYYTYLHRKCGKCSVKQKRIKNWYFEGTDAVKFEKTWRLYKGTEEQFMQEALQLKNKLMKCSSKAEVIRFGLWAIYNETVIRQNRAFPHYGICVLMPNEMPQ